MHVCKDNRSTAFVGALLSILLPEMVCLLTPVNTHGATQSRALSSTLSPGLTDVGAQSKSYSSYSPPGRISRFFSSTPFKYSYTANVTACPGATLSTLGEMPIQNARIPSCLYI